MAPRANWKGYLKVGELSCPVALYTAASTSDRVSFHILNRRTGNRVQRQMVDSDSGKPVDKDDIVKGYEVSSGEYVVLEQDEIAAAVPQSDKVLDMDTFIPCGEVDTVYIDRPYYLEPADEHAAEAFQLIRASLEKNNLAGLAQTVLFRRVRTVLVRPSPEGLIASTMNYEYEVRPAQEIFKDLPKLKIEGEMMELAEHIINTKRGKFDPTKFEDRYETALAALIKAKIEGRKPPKKLKPVESNVTSLLDALRQSAGAGKAPAKGKDKTAAKGAGKKPAAKKPSNGRTAKTAAPQKKAG